jgi:hypothetical protein
MIISIVVNGLVCVFYTSLVSEYKYYCANTIYTSANNNSRSQNSETHGNSGKCYRENQENFEQIYHIYKKYVKFRLFHYNPP